MPRVGGSLRVLRLPPPLKTGRHDIAEILLKKALKHQKSNKKSIKLQARHIDNFGCFGLSILRIIKNRQNYTFYRKDMKYVMKYGQRRNRKKNLGTHLLLWVNLMHIQHVCVFPHEAKNGLQCLAENNTIIQDVTDQTLQNNTIIRDVTDQTQHLAVCENKLNLTLSNLKRRGGYSWIGKMGHLRGGGVDCNPWLAKMGHYGRDRLQSLAIIDGPLYPTWTSNHQFIQ